MNSTYPVALFNDIHRYFPAILYEPERFGNVAELLQYIRVQIRTHSDPYIQGLHTYNTAHRQSHTSTPPPPRRYQYTPVGIQTTHTPPTARRVASASVPMSVIFEGNSGTGLNPLNSITGSILRELLIPGSSVLGAVNDLIGTPHQHIMEPVPVHPTAQQIATGSTISIVNTGENTAEGVTEENTCAICQDVILDGSQVRTLNSCEHSFHMGCIDTWLQSHVNCPVYRHDIREP